MGRISIIVQNHNPNRVETGGQRGGEYLLPDALIDFVGRVLIKQVIARLKPVKSLYCLKIGAGAVEHAPIGGAQISRVGEIPSHHGCHGGCTRCIRARTDEP